MFLMQTDRMSENFMNLYYYYVNRSTCIENILRKIESLSKYKIIFECRYSKPLSILCIDYKFAYMNLINCQPILMSKFCITTCMPSFLTQFFS